MRGWKKSAELCTRVPTSFDDAEFTAYMTSVRSVLLADKGTPWAEFAGASNLIGYRYRTFVEELTTYCDAVDSGPPSKHEAVYERERSLFLFLSAGLSCVEALSYSVFALASSPHVLSVPFGEAQQKRASATNLISALRKAVSPQDDVACWEAVESSEFRKRLAGLRNRVIHRSNLPNVHTVGSPPPLPSTSLRHPVPNLCR